MIPRPGIIIYATSQYIQGDQKKPKKKQNPYIID